MGNDEVRARTVIRAPAASPKATSQLAKSAGAPILGFNVRASKQARDLAEREGVEIRYYAIIYDLLDDMKGVLSGMLAPLQRETFLGNAAVLQVFDISKTGKIAGCRVSEGVVRKGAKVRIIRDDVVVLELGTLHDAQALQGRGQRGPVGPGVRHAFPGLPGHQGRRLHRVLHRRRDQAHAGLGALVSLPSWGGMSARSDDRVGCGSRPSAATRSRRDHPSRMGRETSCAAFCRTVGIKPSCVAS